MKHFKTLFLAAAVALLPTSALAGDELGTCKITDWGSFLCYHGDDVWSCRPNYENGNSWHCSSKDFEWETDCAQCTGGDVPEDCDRDEDDACVWPLALYNSRGEELIPRDNDCAPCLYGCTETEDALVCLPPPGTHPGRGGGHYHVKEFKIPQTPPSGSYLTSVSEMADEAGSCGPDLLPRSLAAPEDGSGRAGSSPARCAKRSKV